MLGLIFSIPTRIGNEKSEMITHIVDDNFNYGLKEKKSKSGE